MNEIKRQEKTKKFKRLAINIPIEKHIEIKTAAASYGLTIKEFIEDALYSYSKILKQRK